MALEDASEEREEERPRDAGGGSFSSGFMDAAREHGAAESGAGTAERAEEGEEARRARRGSLRRNTSGICCVLGY